VELSEITLFFLVYLCFTWSQSCRSRFELPLNRVRQLGCSCL